MSQPPFDNQHHQPPHANPSQDPYDPNSQGWRVFGHPARLQLPGVDQLVSHSNGGGYQMRNPTLLDLDCQPGPSDGRYPLQDITNVAANTPLPPDSPGDFPSPLEFLKENAVPAKKIAGARRLTAKEKGKQRADPPSLQPTKRKAVNQGGSKPKKQKQKGRARGAANYSAEDVEALLDIVEELLPLGAKGWGSVEEEFAEWARDAGRPERTAKSLENKFKQLAKVKKPTGDGVIPDEVARAHEIEDAMNEKAGTRDLDDEDIADDLNSSSSDDDDDDDNEEDDHDDADATRKPDGKSTSTSSKPAKSAKVKTEPGTEPLGPITRRPINNTLSLPSRGRASNRFSDNILAGIGNALDPAAQAARAEERSVQRMQTMQLMTLQAQLRESQQTIETLRTQLANAERRADKFEMMLMFGGSRGRRDPSPPPSSTPSSSRSHLTPVHSSQPTPPRWALRTPSRRVRHDYYYADGGMSTQYVHPDDTPPLKPLSPGTRVVVHQADPDDGIEFVAGSPYKAHQG